MCRFCLRRFSRLAALALIPSVIALSAFMIGVAVSCSHKAEQYRQVDATDNLNCSVRTSSIESHFDLVDGKMVRLDSGELVDLKCEDNKGTFKRIELASTKMVNGKIDTKDFGAILSRGQQGGLFSGTPWMQESNIKKLRSFLGF